MYHYNLSQAHSGTPTKWEKWKRRTTCVVW